jgi:CDP-diacylglycerol---glycerol-3-phosphate 3-phosphatidyltransferase
MLNPLRPALNRVLTPIGEALARTPVTPNAITVTGTVGVAAAALGLLPTGHLFAGAVVCTVFVLADMLDGALARVKGTSGAWGAFLDSTLDRVGDAAIFAGLAAWLARGGHQPLLAGVTVYCLVAGAMVSYARARAEGLGVRADVGVAERSERIIIILLSTGLSGLGVPYILPVGLWALAALSTITFGQRVLAVRRAVGPGAPGQAAGGPGPAGTGPDRPGPVGTGHAGTGPVGTEPDRTGPDSTGPDSTGEGTG